MFHFPISDGVRVLACVRVGACVCCGGGGGGGGFKPCDVW